MNNRKPSWLKIKIPDGKMITYVENLLVEHNLNSVCKSAKCPNRTECYSNKTATFLILGNICTRACRFCNIDKGIPQTVDNLESENIAKVVNRLGLEYVVITSVTRDDLVDGGSSHFVNVVNSIRKKSMKTEIELLVPDFLGNLSAIDNVINCNPTVINHNIETVERLYSSVRIGASYDRSLELLKRVKEKSKIITKSGIILGMGEKDHEIEKVLNHLREVNCDLLTIGQYCQPTKKHLDVISYITPEKFKYWYDYAIKLGFKGVASGPLIRSSYNARRLLCSI
ncbi:MAG: lipoyl synthase [Spirochaetales bacterium]|nr:lipoyl synthase [Spirochaetales bacterium]